MTGQDKPGRGQALHSDGIILCYGEAAGDAQFPRLREALPRTLLGALSVGLAEEGSWSGCSAQSWRAQEGSVLSLG